MQRQRPGAIVQLFGLLIFFGVTITSLWSSADSSKVSPTLSKENQLQQAIVASEKQFGQEHTKTLTLQLMLARHYETTGAYHEAHLLLEKNCPRIKRLFGASSRESAICLAQWAAIEKKRGRYPEAEKHLKKALGIRQTAQLSLRYAELHRLQGRYTQAEQILNALIAQLDAIPKEKKITLFLFEIKNILAKLHEDQGNFDEAEQLTREILNHEKTTLGLKNPNTLTTLNNLAGIMRRKGRYSEAETAYRKALDGFRSVLGERHPATITLSNNLGLVLENQGLYDRAEPLFRTATTLSRTILGAHHPTTLANTNNLAMLHESQGLFDQARRLYEETLQQMIAVHGPTHPDTLAIINNLAYLLMLMEKYDLAESRFKEVLSAWRAQLGTNHQKSLKALNNLARVTHYTGNLKSAEPLLQESLKRRTEQLGAEHIDTLRSMHDLAALYRDQGRHQEAETLLKRTLELDEKILGRLHPYTFETLNTLAEIYEITGETLKAFSLRRRVFERRSRFLNRMLWVTGENAREGYVRLHRPELNAFLDLTTKMRPEQAGRQAFAVGLQRKGILLKIASEIQQITQLSEDTAMAELTNTLIETRKKLAALTLSGPTEETKEDYLSVISRLETQIHTLQGELGRASIRYREAITQPDVTQLIEALPDGSAIVDFLVYHINDEPRLLAGVLNKEDEEEYTFDLVTYENLPAVRQSIREFREIIQDEEADDDEIMEFGMDIHTLVWEPLEEALGEVEKVYIVPDGMLNILPFNALVTQEEMWLLQTVDLHILSSSRDLLPSRIPVATGPTVIMAGPDYDANKTKNRPQKRETRERTGDIQQAMRGASHGMRGLHFDPLPGAEKEGDMIDRQIIQSKRATSSFFRNNAEEQQLQALPQPPSILHIATHGFFLKPDDHLKKRLLKLQRGGAQLPPPGDNPLLRAGLAFSGVNANAPYLGEIDTANDGVLTALEVLSLDLAGTELAVLSACETGLGELHEGEGVYGLRRSFQEAGVRSVINSLWEVSDAGTQALMTGLYERILKGEATHDALRNTQLEMLKSDRWYYPYIWSAFFMVERR